MEQLQPDIPESQKGHHTPAGGMNSPDLDVEVRTVKTRGVHSKPSLKIPASASQKEKEIDAAKAIAKRLDIPYVDPTRTLADPSALSLLEPETAFRRQVLPIRMVNDDLLVLMGDPDQPVVIKSLELLTGFEIRPAAAPQSSLSEAINKYYGNRHSGSFHEKTPGLEAQTLSNDPVKEQQDTTRNISIISNKGGVGKTHLSINLAYARSKAGDRVLLIDADLGNADISNKLGMFPKYHLMDFLEKKKDIRELVTPTKFGFDFIGGSYGEFKLANLVHAQKTKFIKHFKKISHQYDLVVFDLGAGISRTVLDFALAADHTIVVTTPMDVISGYACIKAAFSRFKEIEERLEERISEYEPQLTFCPMVVVNQVNDIRQGSDIFNSIKKTAETNINGRESRFRIRLEYTGSILYDKESMRLAEGKRSPVLLTSPRIKAAQSMQHISARFQDSEGTYDPNVKFMTPLKRFAAILSQKT